MRLEQQRVQSQKAQRGRQARTLGLIIGAVVLAALAIAVFSADDAQDASTADSSSTTSPAVANPNVILPGEGASIEGETPCPPADGSAERTTSFEQAPPMCIDPAKAYTATLETTAGDIVLELDAAGAPETVNNFVVLARYRFYDNVPFHRIVPGFVNQAGDPVGPQPGTGGPGYTIPDELPGDPATAYPPGAVAMANSGPESGGSQFFLVIGDPNGALSGSGAYSVFGKVVEGQDVSEAINALGGADQLPTEPVAITSVTITET